MIFAPPASPVQLDASRRRFLQGLFCRGLPGVGLARPRAWPRRTDEAARGVIAATASQWHRNAGQLQLSLTHTSSALAFLARMTNDQRCWQQRAPLLHPARGAYRACHSKGWLPSTLGASFLFHPGGAWQRAVSSRCAGHARAAAIDPLPSPSPLAGASRRAATPWREGPAAGKAPRRRQPGPCKAC